MYVHFITFVTTFRCQNRSTVLEDVKFNTLTDSSTLFAYFYFDFRDPEKQNCHSLVASLIDQLAFSCSEVVSQLEKLYSQHRSGREEPSFPELVNILQMMFTLHPKRTYIIIDALDECNRHSEWSTLIELLQTVSYWNLQNVRLLCTSRPEKTIADGLSGFSHGINLESS